MTYDGDLGRSVFTYELVNSYNPENVADTVESALENQGFAIAPTIEGRDPTDFPMKGSSNGDAVTAMLNGNNEVKFLYTDSIDEESLEAYLERSL